MTQAIRPETIDCARCGVAKKVGPRGPLPTYCSALCRAALKYERSLEDGRYEQALAGARQRTTERRASNARPCPYCSALMDNPRRKQCGEVDCKRAFDAERMRDWNRRYQADVGQWYHRNYAEQQREYGRRYYREHPHWRVLQPARGALVDARRRMRMQLAGTGEVFAPLDVHGRDGWTCRLCMQPIDPEIAWPNPMSPSVDHVIPLSRGGAHAMHNVQSAHLGCNSSKGDRDMADMVIRAGVQAATR